MPAWATVLITLGSSTIAVAGTLFATRLQLRHSDKAHTKEEARRRRERAAKVLGRIRTLLSDAEPARISINASPDRTPAQLDDLDRRWASLRDELSVFAAEDDDRELTEVATQLDVAVSTLLNRVRWHARDLLHPGTQPAGFNPLNEANVAFGRATLIVRLMLDLIRGDDPSETRESLRRFEKVTQAPS